MMQHYCENCQDPAVETKTEIGNIRIAQGFYCSSKCAVEKVEIYKMRVQEGFICLRDNVDEHVKGTCKCEIRYV